MPFSLFFLHKISLWNQQGLRMWITGQRIPKQDGGVLEERWSHKLGSEPLRQPLHAPHFPSTWLVGTCSWDGCPLSLDVGLGMLWSSTGTVD